MNNENFWFRMLIYSSGSEMLPVSVMKPILQMSFKVTKIMPFLESYIAGRKPHIDFVLEPLKLNPHFGPDIFEYERATFVERNMNRYFAK